jgi:hypothetical protein
VCTSIWPIWRPRSPRRAGCSHPAVVSSSWTRDWDGLLIDGEPKDVTRATIQAHADSFRNPWIGRSYRRLLTQAGFADVTVHAELVPITAAPLAELVPKLAADAAVEAGAVERDESERWLADQRTGLEEGTFFAAMTYFTAVARRGS